MRSEAHNSSIHRRVAGPVAAVAVVVGLVAGCGSSARTSAPTTQATAATTVPAATTATTAAGSGSVPTTTPASGATTPQTLPLVTTIPPVTVPAGPRPCATSQLQLALSNANGTAGSTYVTLDLLNNGPTCTINGYPGVSYVTGTSGTQVGAPATRDPSTPATTLTVATGHAAQSQLRIVDPYNFDAATCQLTPVLGFRVYPPGQTAAAFVSDPGKACASTSLPQPALFVGAASAGPANGGIG